MFEIALYKVEYVGELIGVRDRHIAASDGFTNQLARDFELAARAQCVVLPMTPVEATSTSAGLQPSVAATRSAVRRAVARPGSPVAAVITTNNIAGRDLARQTPGNTTVVAGSIEAKTIAATGATS